MPVGNPITDISSAGNYVPITRTLTINGVAFDLSANRAWTVGTGSVTSVGLIMPTGFAVSSSPITSSGDLTVAFASGYSLPTTASQTNWDTAYTNRITSLTTTGNSGVSTLISNTLNVPEYTLAGLGGMANVFTTLGDLVYSNAGGLPVRRSPNITTTKMFLSQTGDGTTSAAPQWEAITTSTLGAVPTSRQLTINGTAYDLTSDRSWSVGTITSLTGEATASGTGAVAVTLTNSAVIGKVLTGLNLVAGGTIAATDTILQAFGKVQNQVSALVGGVMYEGVWNATTNSPSISSGVGNKGDYYVVNVAGSTTVDGISDWKIGDWIIFNGTVWDKVDNTDAVSSVNGFTGAVSLTTANISEVTNLYYTDVRSRLAVSLTTTGSSGASTYNNTTGVFNIPEYTLSGLGGVASTRTITINGTAFDLSADRTYNVGTVTSVALSVPTGLSITGSPITGSGTLAIGLQAGYSIPTTSSQTNWDAAYNDKINSAAVTGTTTKTLTLNQQDGGTVTATWTDDNTDAVTSVFGRTGAVVAVGGDYNTSQVTEVTNLYYTDTRARLALSFAAGSGAYNNTTGVITIPTNTNQLTNGASFITLSSLSATSPLSYNNTTGAFTISEASGSTNGFLSSTNFTNFLSGYNDKINSAAVTGTTTKTLTLTQQDGGTITANWTDDNTDAVTSVFGRTGVVVATNGDYNTSQVTELTNLYFTDARARSAISLTTTGTSGLSTYNSTTGVLNVPGYTAAGLGAVPTSRTLTINDVAFDLSADRSFSVGDFGTW
jgi:hypothetical protein